MCSLNSNFMQKIRKSNVPDLRKWCYGRTGGVELQDPSVELNKFLVFEKFSEELSFRNSGRLLVGSGAVIIKTTFFTKSNSEKI